MQYTLVHFKITKMMRRKEQMLEFGQHGPKSLEPSHIVESGINPDRCCSGTPRQPVTTRRQSAEREIISEAKKRGRQQNKE